MPCVVDWKLCERHRKKKKWNNKVNERAALLEYETLKYVMTL